MSERFPTPPPESYPPPRSPNRRIVAVGAAAGALTLATGLVIAGLTGWGGSIDDEQATPGADSATVQAGSTPDADGGGVAEAADAGDPLTTAVAAQLAYVEANWQRTEHDVFGFLPENDCVNFTSQSLLARGWTVDEDWWYDESGDPYAHAPAWISSTAFHDRLAERPDLATALTDDQRNLVRVGDVVQFDWDDSGDRDHTGVVTSVERDADGELRIRYAGHTDATWDRSVDWAITELHPGGVAYYWSLAD